MFQKNGKGESEVVGPIKDLTEDKKEETSEEEEEEK
jgi:hypothetical protein